MNQTIRRGPKAGDLLDGTVRCNCSMSIRVLGDGCEICNPDMAEEIEADNIEMEAAGKSYACGFGVSEWESFLTTESGARLAELARNGRGTWGKEGRIPEPYNSANDLRQPPLPVGDSTNTKDAAR